MRVSDTVFGLLVTAVTLIPSMHTSHQAAPVSRAHAMLNQNCANCHDTMCGPLLRLFSTNEVVSVSDNQCKECHKSDIHHAKQSREPACASCHREHQGHDVLASHVADRNCVQCHGDLPANLVSGATTLFHPTITKFHRDHPEFGLSMTGKKDQAKIEFNHKAHLDLDLEA